MYVPPYESLLRALNTERVLSEKIGKVTLPLPLFKLLLQIAIGSSDFDEDVYLDANPDVRIASDRGEIESGLAHYIGFGYFEGRRGGLAFDQNWYLERYSDIAQALLQGEILSAEEHFYKGGGGEGRSPNAVEQEAAAGWKKALQLV